MSAAEFKGEITGEIEARVLALVATHARNPVEPGPATDIVTDAGMDSVAVMDFVLDLEESFDITIPLDRLTDIRTVADVVGEVRAIVQESAH
ncbi:MAG TPA: acyl carrier protein [Paracoccaceae bacterium]|nr:acyl carrier protein [Paracoccaceae bacterium]